MAATRRKTGFSLPKLAPVILIKGTEKALQTKAKIHVLQEARSIAPDLERQEVQADKYSPGILAQIASPSLFSAAKLIEVTGVESATSEFVVDLEKYLQVLEPEIWILLQHSGGNGGKKVVSLVEKTGMPIVICDKVKYPSGHEKLVVAEAIDAGGEITPAAAAKLVDAFGERLSDLLAATRQLVQDTGPKVDLDGVEKFFQGRAEITVFQVADLAVNKDIDRTRSLVLLRQAFAAGVKPVEIVGALAVKLRTMAKVRTGASASELGMSPWQAREAKKNGQKWSDQELASAIQLISELDWQTKGGSKNPEGAVEACLIKIQRLAY